MIRGMTYPSVYTCCSLPSEASLPLLLSSFSAGVPRALARLGCSAVALAAAAFAAARAASADVVAA